MKITFVLPIITQNGGSRVVAIYAEKLRDMGHEIAIVARAPKIPSFSRKILNRLRGVASLPEDRKKYFDNLSECLVEFNRDGPPLPEDFPEADVIVATWWRTAFEIATLPPGKGAKAYFIQHHEVHKYLPWDLSAGSYYLPLKKITISNWLVETMANVYGDHNVPKVENSVDTVQFTAPPRARNAKPRLGFLYSATPFKGVDISLRAIEIARKNFPDLEIMAFGVKDPSPDLPLPPNSRFHKLPDQNQLRELYAQCDVWLCGSRAEGFHLPPLEAMACRTPVVSTRIGGAVETVTDGVNGYLAEVEDAEGLAAGLNAVLSKSPEEWQAMSEAAYARAHSYSWNDAAQAFEAELKKILAQGTGR